MTKEATEMGQLPEHPELRALRNFGVSDATIESFEVLCLPENVTDASSQEQLIDAGDAADFAKLLKEANIRCATSYDLTPEAKIIDRRGADIWLGIIWFLGCIALPLCLNVLANMLVSRSTAPTKQTKVTRQQRVHVKLRIRRANDVDELDYSGDAKTLRQLLLALKAPDNDLD